MSRFPFPDAPNGWFQVAWSDELAPGEARPVRAFGRDLVLFRTESGQARVFDAWCPHLGAHLGVGGRVEGETLRCPFHAWRFDGEGRCVEIPYAKRIPPAARVPCWPTREVNGLVMVWHHAERAAPDYELPELPEIGSPDWTPYVKRRYQLRTHCQEMGENLVDAAHFRYVHGTLTVAEGSFEEDGPRLHVLNRARMGTPRGEVDGTIDVHMWGPGFATVRFGGIVDTLLVESTTPIDGETVDVFFSFSVKRTGDADATRGVGRALIADIDKQIREDRPIWENKVYHARPVLCDGDGPIPKWRRWYRQFYSERPHAA